MIEKIGALTVFCVCFLLVFLFDEMIERLHDNQRGQKHVD